MARLLLLLTFTLCVGRYAISQANNVYGDYFFKGRIVDQNSAVVPGLSLVFTDGEQSGGTVTDINGDFEIGLRSGSFVLTFANVPDKSFRAFISIVKNGLNPQNVEFPVDSTNLCRTAINGFSFPKVLSSAEPVYPAAASAVRAYGTVLVEVRINPEGKVANATAIFGHPLLRKASENAAQKFLFEASDVQGERRAIIEFVFTLSSEKKVETKRFTCPYRIVINRPPLVVLDSSGSY